MLTAMKRIFIIIFFLALCPSLFSQEWSVPIDLGYPCTFRDEISVDNGESVLSIGYTSMKDGFLVKVNKDGAYIDRVVHLPGMILRYHSAVQLDNGNYMVFGVCDDSLCDPDFQKHIRVDVFDSELEPVESKMYDVEDEPFICVLDTHEGTKLMAILSPSGTVILAAALSYYVNMNGYGYYKQALQLYELDREGNILVKKPHTTAEVNCFRGITYEPNSDNLLIALTGGFFPPSYQGTPGIYVIDMNLEIVARQNLHNVQGGWGFEVDLIEDITTDGKWFDGDLMIFHALKSELNHRTTFTYSSLYKLDSALHVYGELRLPPYDSCTWIPSGTSTAYINDSTIFVFTYCAESMLSFDTHQTNVLLVDKHLNLLGRKTIKQDHVFTIVGEAAVFNDGGCVVPISKRNTEYYQGAPFFQADLVKFKREDIEITWDVVSESSIFYESNVYPNPAKEIIIITVNDGFTHKARIQIIDTKGLKCLDSTVGDSGYQIWIDTQNLESGLYIYRLMSDNRELARGKFVKE